jgi:hypothetical protein
LPRFALLRHAEFPTVSAEHFDLLLQTQISANPDDRVLLTFAFIAADFNSRHPLLLRLQPPHRQMYLDYEGPVKGNAGTVGGRGAVKKADGGILEWLSPKEINPEKPPAEFTVAFHGALLCAEFFFRKDLSLQEPHWRMQKISGNISTAHTD